MDRGRRAARDEVARGRRAELRIVARRGRGCHGDCRLYPRVRRRHADTSGRELATPPRCGRLADYNRRFARSTDGNDTSPRLRRQRSPPATKRRWRELDALVRADGRRASCRSTACSRATGAAPSCWASAAPGWRPSKQQVKVLEDGPAEALDSTHEARRFRRLGARRQADAVETRAASAGCPSDAPAGLGAGDALRRARRRQARCARCWCWPPREAVDGAARGRAARRRARSS